MKLEDLSKGRGAINPLGHTFKGLEFLGKAVKLYDQLLKHDL